MKYKHFKFDLDCLTLSNANAFQNIKIDQRSLNQNKNKLCNGLKRFSIKNAINFSDIPEVMYFQKSIKKNKSSAYGQKMQQLFLNQIQMNSSNETKKKLNQKENLSEIELNWQLRDEDKELNKKQLNLKLDIFKNKVGQQQNHNINQKTQSRNISSNQIRYIKQIEKQKKDYLQKIVKQNLSKGNSYRQVQELESLEECMSQVGSSKCESIQQHKNVGKMASQKKREVRETFIQTNQDQNKLNLIKNRKTSFSQNSGIYRHNLQINCKYNPQIISNKSKVNKKAVQCKIKDKDLNKLWNSLLVNEKNKNAQKKFIALNKKSYYVIGSKNNKHRSLNKQKKQKNKSEMEQINVILTNEDCTEKSSSIPQNCRNSSSCGDSYNDENKISRNSELTLQMNEKVKIQSCKSTKQSVQSKTFKGKRKNEMKPKDNRNQKRTNRKIQKQKKQQQKSKQQKRVEIQVNSKNEGVGQGQREQKQKNMEQKLMIMMLRTGQILRRYEEECSQLRREKEECEMRCKQAQRKLQRIKQELGE